MGLGKFEGNDVLGIAVVITKVGDGLSKPMEIDPVTLKKGDVVHFAGRGIVTNIAFKPIKDTNGVSRVQTIDAESVAIVDGDEIEALLLAQEQAIADHEAEEAARKERELEDAEQD